MVHGKFDFVVTERATDCMFTDLLAYDAWPQSGELREVKLKLGWGCWLTARAASSYSPRSKAAFPVSLRYRTRETDCKPLLASDRPRA